jgi:hypothetical protein
MSMEAVGIIKPAMPKKRIDNIPAGIAVYN